VDCRIIDAIFTLGFCFHRRKYTKLYGRTIEAETSHTVVGATQLIGKGVVINLAYHSVRCTVLLEYIVLYS
jgi:hypothetical protein